MQRSEAFQLWVRAQGGEHAVAKRIGVSPGTLHNWMARQRWPGTEYIREILRLAKGALTFEDILDSTEPLPKGRRPGPGRKNPLN